MACRVASAAAIPVKGSPIPPVEVGLPERGLVLAQGGWYGLDGGNMADRSNSNGCLGKLSMGDASTLWICWLRSCFTMPANENGKLVMTLHRKVDMYGHAVTKSHTRAEIGHTGTSEMSLQQDWHAMNSELKACTLGRGIPTRV